MQRIFTLNKNYFTNGLVSRLFFQTLILLIIGGVLILNETKKTYANFTQTQVTQEFTLLSQHLHLLTKQAFNEMLSNNEEISADVLRITQAKVMPRLTAFFKQYQLPGGVMKDGQFIHKNFQLEDQIISYQGKHITDIEHFLANDLLLNKLQQIQVGNEQFFIYKLAFTPWQWEIVFVKNRSNYVNDRSISEKSINILILLTLLILSLGVISYLSIFKPILQITKAITNLQPPNYKGIVEFEFLSDHIHHTMEKLFTSIKAANKAEQIKANFLANMSHEIRTPINAIIGLNHLALQGRLQADTQHYLNKINSASQALSHIVNDILDYSKIEAQQVVIDNHIFSLDELLCNLMNVATVGANEKNLEIIIIGQQQVPDQLYGDTFRINQVLLNLLNNAIKFSQSGHVLLSIKKQSQRIQFSVKDNGIGISAEQLSQLFRPFTQADSSTTRQFGGTGLGLTISKRLIELMGGELHVESELGIGSNFYFDIPVAIPFELKVAQSTLVEPIQCDETIKNSRLLIIEPNSTTRQAIGDVSRWLQFPTQTADSMQKALSLLSDSSNATHSRYDFILIDEKIGEDNILTLAGLAKKTTKNTAPFVILMASELVNNSKLANAVDALLKKPLTIKTLLAQMHRLKIENSTSAIHSAASKANRLLGIQILIVEDNLMNQQVATDLLKSEGAIITVANNGLNALEIINAQHGKFDVVLMDIQMPIIDGYQACAMLRKQYTQHQLPIIALSAMDAQKDHEKSISFGFNSHINKPFDPETLFKTVLASLADLNADRATHMPPAAPAPVKNITQLERIFPRSLLTDNSPLHIAKALKNIGGDSLFLKKLLQQFYRNHLHDMNKINQALADNNIQAIEQITHTLKGVAATIAANDVYQKAALISQIVHDQQQPSQDTIDQLATSLTTLLNELYILYEASPLPKNNHIKKVNSSKNSNNMKRLTTIFNRLEKALWDGSFRAKADLSELQSRLYDLEHDLDITQLIVLVDNVEFSEAHRTLLHIAKKSGIKINQDRHNNDQ